VASNFRNFATWILQRGISYRDRNRRHTVVFRGNHVSYFFARPIRADDETMEAFRCRLKKWRSRLPRGSTLSIVLALAHEAFVRAGEKDEAAAELTCNELEKVVSLSAQQKTLCAQLPAKPALQWIVIDHHIGTSHRHRIKRSESDLPEWERNRNTVRTQVSRLKRKCENFDQLFDASYGRYLYDNRSDEWFRQNEPAYRERFERNRKDPVMANSFLIASEACELARMYRNVGRVADAVPLYQFALEFWRTHGDQWPHLRADNIRKLQEEIETLPSNAGRLPC
jgi:hypothetical protein